MLVAILSKPWWKSLVKGSEGEAESGSVQKEEQREMLTHLEPPALRDETPEAEPRKRGDEGEGNRDEAPRKEERRSSRGGKGGAGNERRAAVEPTHDEGDEEEESDTASLGGEEEAHDEDPFAPAYDLEHGQPIAERLTSGASFPWKSKIKSAKEFFAEELLYRFDILEKQDRDEIRGKYRMELKGYRGGIWTVDLGDELTVVNRREDADIVFAMQQKDFLHLVNGEINPQLAILAQKLRVQGDIRKAVAFQKLLVPSSE